MVPTEEPARRKQLDQHHLRHASLCAPVVRFLAPDGQRVLEIGPGGGLLTGELLAAGARVMAVEVDPAWAFHLVRADRFASLRLWIGDAMELAWERLAGPILVAGNLPYSIATALIDDLLYRAPGVPRAAFLIQHEVAERMLAAPGDRRYGAFTVLVAAQAHCRLLARVRPGSFQPPPKVQSAFVGLERRPPPFPCGEASAFRATVHQAFAQRRKMLVNSLSAGWGRSAAMAVVERAGLDGRRRAETLDLAEFAQLHEARLDLGRLDAKP